MKNKFFGEQGRDDTSRANETSNPLSLRKSVACQRQERFLTDIVHEFGDITEVFQFEHRIAHLRRYLR